MSKTTTFQYLRIFLITLLISFTGQAQQTNNWYFGSPTVPNAGLRIDFTSGAPVVTRGYPIATEEGSSSISNAAGTPLFYTDGLKIWDASTNTTFGTGMLGGTSSTQSAIVMPKPGAVNQWLVFTSGQTGLNGINYYTVSGTPGAFTLSAATNLTGANTVGEGLFIIGSTKPGSAFWVIARDLNATGVVRAWDVTNTGVVNTTAVTSTLSNAGWTQTNYLSKIGTIKSNTCQNKLAFTYLSGDVDLTDFNSATGTVVANTARRITVTSAGGNSGSYGIEFSPNDTYLYITNLAGNQVYRYNVTLGGAATVLGTTAREAGQLQSAPDGKIYVAINGEMRVGNGYLGVITNPDLAGATFTEDALLITTSANPNGYCFRGLPTFPKSLVITDPVIRPGDTTICAGATINFSYLYAGSTSSVSWDFGDPGSGALNTSTVANPSHQFNSLGTFTVTVTINDVCSRVWTDNIQVSVVAAKVPAASYSCTSGQITLNATGAVPGDYPNYTYYNAATGGKVLAIGNPAVINYGAAGNVPASIWVEVASSASVASSGTNQSIGMAAAGLSWAANGSPYGPLPFNVLSDVLTLKSFVVKSWNTTGNFDVEIRDASSNVVFLRTYTIATANTPFTVNINYDFPKGNNYQITFKNTSHQWYGGSWAGATNAGQITLPTFGGAGTYGMANLIYDYKNFSITTTCSQRVQVNLSCPLPVRWLDFSAHSEQAQVQLYWSTVSEQDNDYFEVQRSSDGSHFTTIGLRKGQGTSQSVSFYNFIDSSPESGTVYYRLVQHDYNGEVSYSTTIALEFSGPYGFTIQPNPSAGVFTIAFAQPISGFLIIEDALGKTVYGQSLDQGMRADLSTSLSKGIYLVSFISESGRWVQKLVIE